ncbi:uncharacterized protein LOC112904713 [Agrilus planipennis]|uniref:Uncharacterized protein LOC112904713 n=1 Tax=Agrilus planipennis TaxID=224129 RepID=A0A7F5R5V0_AGRPL|nr:uncharacterized protein LOC112904713 [Agrilus planipennis]
MKFLPFILIFLISIFPLHFCEENFLVTQIQHNPGIYFEKMANVQFYSNEWKLITHVDIKQYLDNFERLVNFNDRTISMCNKLKDYVTSTCSQYLAVTREIIQKIKAQTILVQDLVGSNNLPLRKRRGLFDIIGKAEKILFGTPDADDALYYDKTISEISENERKMHNLLVKQTSVVQGTVHSINQTISNVVHNEALVQKNLDELADSYKLMYSEVSNVRTNIDIEVKFLEHVNILTSIINQYQIDIQNLINALIVARVGQIHPSILSPNQLIAVIKKLFPTFPRDYTILFFYQRKIVIFFTS